MEVTLKDKTLTCHVKDQADLDVATFMRDRFSGMDGAEFKILLCDRPPQDPKQAPAPEPKPAKTTKGSKSTKSTKAKQQKEPVTEAPAEAPLTPVSKEATQELLKQYAALAGVDKAVEALAKYNAQKISDLSDDDREKFVADLKKDMPTNG